MRSRHSWARLPIAMGLAIAVVALGCSRGNDSATPSGDTVAQGSADTTPDVVKAASADKPKTGGKLVYGLEAETDGWDPTVNRWAASGTQIALAVFDPLVVLDKDLQWKPYLAEAITPNTDFTQWTVKLRSGVKFHDGTPVNADALVKSVNAFKASTLTGAAAKPIIGVDKVDDLSVKFTMDMPWATWPFGLTGQAGVLPAPAQLDDKDNGQQHPIGSGPFKYQSWQRDNVFVAVKNTDYWRKSEGLPYLDEIDFRPIPDATARYNSLKSGDINLTVTSAETTIAKLLDDAKNGDVQVTRSIGNNDVNMVLMNLEDPVLSNLKVRQAMAYALDKRTLDDISQVDPSLDANTVYQAESKWYTPAPDYPTFDLEKAKSLVQQVGPVEFTLNSTTDPDTLKAAQAMAQMWTAAGMKVAVNTVDQPSLIANAVTGKFQVQVWRQFGGADPDLNYVWWISDNTAPPLALNMARNKNPEIDAALKEGRSTTDETKRKAAYTKIQQQQTQTLPYLWLNHLRWTLGATNNVRGLQGMPLPGGGQSSGLVGGVIPVTGMWLDN